MKFLKIITICYCIIFCNITFASSLSALSCKKDLEFFKKSLELNSSAYANKLDQDFQKWFNIGYQKTLKLINEVETDTDCYYALKYYSSGFKIPHISLSKNIALPQLKYPGLLTIKEGEDHKVVYKNPDLEYLNNIDIGDKITHINDIKISDYYRNYLLPFYSNDNSESSQISASLNALILDGNQFTPVPKNITVLHGGKSVKITMQYTELNGSAFLFAQNIKKPEDSSGFSIEEMENLIWIKIPSFSPGELEIAPYQTMLSNLKNNFAKYEHILFDLRGNGGGNTKWSRPIIRNLWGDDFIKSLGNNHDYNKIWLKKIRTSKDGLEEFKRNYSPLAAKAYASSLRSGEEFFIKKWSVFDDKVNLYSNMDSSPMKSKIYVLTDNFCRSTCWAFTNELKQMPNVVHMGKKTTIQSKYSFAKRVTSPTNHFYFFYPTQIRISPEYNIGQEIVPSKIYNGNINDEVKMINWVFSNLS